MHEMGDRFHTEPGPDLFSTKDVLLLQGRDFSPRREPIGDGPHLGGVAGQPAHRQARVGFD